MVFNFFTSDNAVDYQLRFQQLVGTAASAFLVALSIATLIVINVVAPAENQLAPSVLTTSLVFAGILAIRRPVWRRSIFIVIFCLRESTIKSSPLSYPVDQATFAV